jgi:glycerol-3-phosphate dehydrogenase
VPQESRSCSREIGPGRPAVDAGVVVRVSGEFDVVVIGGGVIGTAIAARLSRTNASVCLVEAAADVAEGASKGNAGIAVSYYSGPGTLDADLVNASYPHWEDLCRRLDVPYRRVGAVMAALDEIELANLAVVLEEAQGCGVRAEMLSGSDACRLEPLISPACLGAVFLPDEGIIDPMRLTVAYAELAVRNGAALRLSAPVIGFERDGERLAAVRTPTEVIKARYVVNAAGLGLGTVSALAGGETFRTFPRRGEYWLLDRSFGSTLRHIVFAAPGAETKGIHVIPTTSGTALLGPSVEEGMEPDDVSTHREMLAHVFARVQRLVPSVSLDQAIKSFAANRPVSEEGIRCRMDGQVSNLLHASSRSTGVSTSPGIAERGLGLLRDAGLDVSDRPDAVDSLPAVPRLLHHPDPERLAEVDPRYGQVICVCEQVSAAEIAASLEGPVPATSIAGVWKRTHATGGRCQGSVCMAGVAFMCSLALNAGPGDVPLTDAATLGI